MYFSRHGTLCGILQFLQENLFIVVYYHKARDYILLHEAMSLTGPQTSSICLT